jgi:UPF0716 family protein affecting phage T7 exclusion
MATIPATWAAKRPSTVGDRRGELHRYGVRVLRHAGVRDRRSARDPGAVLSTGIGASIATILVHVTGTICSVAGYVGVMLLVFDGCLAILTRQIARASVRGSL